ncbi:hypothetical protein MAR_021581 [Mya arenaria]|uniref:AUGMIN subunit 5 n=1 Tax=Mya arenaria TaxID=6604 RepID=A0ABY7EBB4_MYAAR|nr:hypothetical protein MAR_021581 [Mya arenaria]
MNRESELARQLHEWTTQEMHFNLQSSHSAALDPEKLKVKSKTSVPSYKVNYDVGGKQFEDSKQALLERRAALTGEITTTLRDVGHFEHEVERITAEVAETERKYQQVKEAINNSRRKAALLTAFCVKSADNAAQYKEYVRCLQTRTATIKSRAQKGLETEEYYSREAAGGDSDDEEETEEKTPALEIASAERNKEHFLSFVQCQKSVNDARNLEQSVSMVKSRIEKKLHKLFSQKSTDLKLARTLVDVEVEVDGQRAALHSLTQETEALKDQKQGVIQVLVKQNMNAQSRLEEQLADISDYIGRSFVSQPSHLTGLTGKLAGTVSQEVDGFANLVLPYLMFSQIDSALKTAVMDLSIHQTSQVHIRPALSTAPECILSQCVQLREDIGDILHRLDREASIASRRTEDDVVVNITELCERARESDSQQLRQTLPRLQEKISRTNQALDNCTHARQAADDWWLEPSQKCVPWVTVDDHTLQQYIDRWTVLVTSLRQQLLHKQ